LKSSQSRLMICTNSSLSATSAPCFAATSISRFAKLTVSPVVVISS
jgi:hypothetical protein